jgi:hypothetical protein
MWQSLFASASFSLGEGFREFFLEMEIAASG